MKIKLKRIEKGIKQQDFAKMLGISKATLVKIEKEEYDIRLSLMKKISELLETPVQELFFD
ncbi:putative transcriptional regulator [Clostridium tetanomorphum]|uniref:helix-turn-helix transcriptional regulator n=1 Tax=Clostridium tetanomorphum TaxID=1553 RepID=UPI0004470E3A|nr:helix-turn-helix transcriptional regulator [Clostridium tetanomorphum]KAJ50046.1 DNA-binding protein [Clostridium tetanomorphum DSM 665]KAJ51315.1 DNA-binding protein [Clostridium tetanomorphum DSM 665]MBP1866183.1 putative transcriptional regulator [Clostridium tetanomorphum]NRS86625.1 putative transcriptional regulator [Clostridium tetanomorphum]NRZ95400.1 putative transcriptional regulator [Clostridium tetanomorphum]